MTVLPPPVAAPARRGPRRLIVRVLTWSLAAVAVVAGLAIAAGTAYAATPVLDHVAVLVAVAVLTGAAVAAGAGLLLATGMGLSRRRGAAVVALLVTVIGAGLFATVAQRTEAAASGTPAGDPRGPHETWQLSTGSRVAVWQRRADVRRHRTPVVFLHGGPGMYTQASKIAEGAALRAAGFDTVYFDQAGGGASDRLPVEQYTLRRAVADVEAVRQHLGTRRVVLWGNSYGGQLAVAYAATYPDRVAGLLLTSPGSFPGQPAVRDYTPTNRPDDTELPARTLLTALLINRNPVLAEDFAGQREAGAMLDAAAVRDLAGGFVCRGADDRQLRAELTAEQGGNLFPNRMIARDVTTFRLPRPRVRVPALVVRGACDFVPRSSAERYAHFTGAARIVDIPGDGHGLRSDRPAVDTAVTGFATTALAAVE